MCGIAGIINVNQKYRGVTQNMLDLIHHRGPDDQGILENFDRKISLGSKRLSIIDLSEKGRMPMQNMDKSVAVCQNGEIYNFKDLKKELAGKGYQFKSESDTEVILHGYREWGEGVFEKLRGMFAIALYDYDKEVAILARDRIGIKPLYYLNKDSCLFFSSEVKAFKAVPEYSLKADVDYDKVELLLGFMFLPDRINTLFKNVKKVEPGCYLKWEAKSKQITHKRYWSLPRINENSKDTFEEAVEKLDDLLKTSVMEHMVSDVPVGILLSGGLDSSLIAAYAQNSTSNKIKTYTARFDHKFNESHNAVKVAEYLGTDHHEVFIDTKNIINNIESYAPIFDDMGTFDGGVISTAILCKELKRQGITVILLGEGSDELFGGYSWFGLSKLPFSILPTPLKATAYYYAISRNISFKTPRYISYWNSIFKQNKQDDVFRTISSVEVNIQLPNHLLMKVDKATMSASVEARVPYLDHRIVEYAFSLPNKYKIKGETFSMNGSNEKYILRKVAEKYLPSDVTTRKKRGFMLPMFDVLTNNIDKVRSYILGADSLTSGIVGRKTLESLLDFNCFGPIKMQKEYLLWRMFLLEVWNKTL